MTAGPTTAAPSSVPEHAQHLDPDRGAPEQAEAGDEPRLGASLEGRPAAPQASTTSKATPVAAAVEADRLVGEQPGDVGLDRGRAVGRLRGTRPGPRRPSPAGCAGSTSGQAWAGSIVSISSWVSRSNWRIRAWKANSVRVRRAANSSSRRTDHEASASASVASRDADRRAARPPGGRPPPVARGRRARRRSARAAGRWPAGAGRPRSSPTPARARRTASPTSASAKRGIAALVARGPGRPGRGRPCAGRSSARTARRRCPIAPR